jgi:hypothetical protein
LRLSRGANVNALNGRPEVIWNTANPPTRNFSSNPPNDPSNLKSVPPRYE